MAQALWRGSISFGLVTIPVRLYSAVRRRDVHFREIERATGRRVRHQRVRELGRLVEEWSPPPTEVEATRLPAPEISKGETARGFEVQPDRYVEVTDQDLESLAPERTRTIDIEQFVSRKDLDPIYFESAYYVVPDVKLLRPFALLLRAMQETNRAAIGWLVLRSRRHLAALQPRGGLMLLSTLLFADEVVPVTELERRLPYDLSEREVETAALLVNTLTGPFELQRYRDEYRERLLALIESRSGDARPLEEPEAPAPAAGVEDLMAALSASIEQARARHAAEGRSRRRQA
ncbi:MAG TPA: Ku protein [Candidatus Acidoferrales bacterium]|nr:Ku protein [Candidatus Acidoferrales bacterium]